MPGYKWCAAVNCRNNSGQQEKRSFFSFPKDPERCRRWVIACRRADLDSKSAVYLNKNCRLCSDHFESAMFLNDLKNRLHSHAIPTVFSVPNPPPSLFPKRRPIKRTPLTNLSSARKRIRKNNNMPEMVEKCSCPASTSTEKEPNNSLPPTHPLTSAEKNSDHNIPCDDASQSEDVQQQQQTYKTAEAERKLGVLQRRMKRLRKTIDRWKSRALRTAERLKFNEDEAQISRKNNEIIPKSFEKLYELFKNETSRHYSVEVKQFAMALYFLSPKAYEFMAQ